VSVGEQAKSGAIKAYGMSATARLALLPAVLTAQGRGVNYLMSIWAGMFAPKGTPAPIVAKLADALDKALDDDDLKQRINNLGGSIPEKRERSPAAFDAYVKAEIARWAPVLKAAAEPEKEPLVRRQSAGLDRAGPFRDLGLDERRQILRRAAIG